MKVEKLFRATCEFKIGATSIEHIPSSRFVEVAFAGRSNVGKSSLLNAIMKRNSLARTSKTPGCTKQINFFLLAEELAPKSLMIADLPGYGYAKVSKKERGGWNKLIKDYLTGRPNLRQVCMLIDSRHDVKKSDEEIMDILDEAAVSYQVILTKADKQNEEGLKEIISQIDKLAVKHTALHPEVIITSSVNNTGLNELRGRLTSFV